MVDDLVELIIYAVLPFLKRRKQRRDEWTGFLEEMTARRGSFLARYTHLAVFRTDNGRAIKLRLDENDASKYTKGIRYLKKAGEDFPAPVD